MPWPIFIISLADAHERRRRIMDQCRSFGLMAEIVDAVDGRSGLPSEYEGRIDRAGAKAYDLGRKMTDGEFACALSHQMIYERILRDDLPGAVVLEDDAILTPEFAEFVRDQGYLAADFIQMDYAGARCHRFRRNYNFNGVRLVQLARTCALTTGYALSVAAAEYIISRSHPLRGPADWPTDITPLHPLITVPRLVYQPSNKDTSSDLEIERRVIDDEAFSLHLSDNRRGRKSRWKRFGRASYWRRWWFKRMTKAIP